MIMENHEEPVVICKDQTQIMIKGKRTKRQRPPTQLSLAIPEAPSSRTTSTDNSGGFALSTTSPAPATSAEEEEDQDMANCLILLAQGGHAGKASSQHVTSTCLYQCKTCNRCFSSFQALGGHRASHKKPNNRPNAEEKQRVTFVNEDNHHYDPTALSLQISGGALYNTSNHNNNVKFKVHECAICGAEFSSGQALGGHMRRHRTFVNTSATSASAGNGSLGQSSEAKKPRNVLKLDLNLPAPEDDIREPKFPFQSKEKVIVFAASSLVDCHY